MLPSGGLVPLAFTRPQKEYRHPCQFQNVDAQDHYVELHAYTDVNFNVEVTTESVSVQAVPTVAMHPVQTVYEADVNVGVQYEPVLFDGDSLEAVKRSRDYGAFFGNVEKVLSHGLDTNVYADPENALRPDDEEYDARGQSTLPEIQALSHAKYTRGKTVSALAKADLGRLTLVFMAVAPRGWQNTLGTDDASSGPLEEEGRHEGSSGLNDYYILVWNVSDNMQPLAILLSPAPVTCMDVHPQRHGTVLLAGTKAGSVLLFDLDDSYEGLYRQLFSQNASTATSASAEAYYNGRNTMTFTQSLSRGLSPQIFYPSISSSLNYGHTDAVTCVKWLPPSSQIMRTGDLQTSASTLGALQFCTLAPDGFINVWSLQCADRDSSRSDMTVLIPFLQLPISCMFPHVHPLRPVSIVFPYTDEPSTFFTVGDAFGRLATSTWPVAVAAYDTMSQDRSKLEKSLQRNQLAGGPSLESLETFFQDQPTKGSCISSHSYFLGSVFHMEYSPQLPNALFAAAADGCKIWLVDRSCHVQASDMAAKGVVDEQTLLQCNPVAAESSGFVVTRQIPACPQPYSLDIGGYGSGAMMGGGNLVLGAALTAQNALYVKVSTVVSSLGLEQQGQQAGSLSSMIPADQGANDLLSNRRPGNLAMPVSRSLESDFPNFDFYRPVFSYVPKEGTITAACLSQSRGGVLFMGTDKGAVAVFDLVDRMHEPLITIPICVGPVTQLLYIRQAVVSGAAAFTQQSQQAESGKGGSAPFSLLPSKARVKTRDVLLVADVHGVVHVLELPRALRAKTAHERSLLRYKFRRSLEHARYVEWRKAIRQRATEERRAAMAAEEAS